MILPILQYGDPILRAKGERIEKIDEGIRQLAVKMIEIMHEAHGVGLAAQQVGQPLQLTVLDVSAVEDRPTPSTQWQRCRSEERDADRADQSGDRVAGETELGVEGC